MFHPIYLVKKNKHEQNLTEEKKIHPPTQNRALFSTEDLAAVVKYPIEKAYSSRSGIIY